jgi:SAM-dependent methyltransferase
MALLDATGLNVWQLIIVGLLLTSVLNYVIAVAMDKMTAPAPLTSEGFVDAAEESKHEWLNNVQLFDPFYAGIYDQLIQFSVRTQIETETLLEKWQFPDRKREQLRIGDLGCGTGCSSMSFAKAGVGAAVGIDHSKAMLEAARTVNLPASVLTAEQKARVEFRERDLADPSAAQPAEFDAACALYFTIYYLKDIDGFFRNCALWVRPGGCLAVQVVNKHKFDPQLDSASPFTFSLQKYSKDRLTKSVVKFDKFDYEGVFDLDEDELHAEFRETFRFKDGTVRRQRHTLAMPDISLIVKKAKAAGWLYEGYLDQGKHGFAYSYILLFKH